MHQLAIVKEKNIYHLFLINNEETKFYQITDLNNKQRKVKKDSCLFVFNSELDNFTSDVVDLTDLWSLLEIGHSYSLDDLSDIYSSNTTANKAILFYALINRFRHYFTQVSEFEFKVNSAEQAVEIQRQRQEELAKEQLYNEYYSALISLQQPNWNVSYQFLLNSKNKDSLEYKSFHNAAKVLNLDLYIFLYKLGINTDLPSLMEEQFIKEIYHEVKILTDVDNYSVDFASIPLNDKIRAFSIDDASTTEIDDALSVQYTDGGYKIGIHIAAPALDYSALSYAVDRVSTVYYPFNKIKMLPDNIINYFSLNEGSTVPVVSIYFNLDEQLQIVDYFYEVEKIYIEKNLRLEELAIEEESDLLKDMLYSREIQLLYKFAITLEQQRGRVSVNPFSMDYSFYLDTAGDIAVQERKRGNPIDKLVSELMILANCSFGRALTNHFIPAIYRVKQRNYPVKMTTVPGSHIGLNVDYYTWASSPLRRSTDLINQYQIISMILGDKKFLTETTAELSYIVDNFDNIYASYLGFQDKMERYWSLRYMLDQELDKIQAVCLYKTQIQVIGLPLKLDIAGLLTPQAQGTIITLAITSIDIASLTLNFKILENVA